MRSRFVIPAVLLVGLAYLKRRLDAYDLEQIQAPPTETDPPPIDMIRRAEAEAADAMAIAEAQTAASATVVLPPVHEPPPAALLAEWAAGPDWSPPPPVPPVEPRREPEPVDEAEPALLSEWTTTPAARPEPAPAAHVAPAPEPAAEPLAAVVVIEESGRFTIGGWAAQPGEMAVCGVTFRDRRGGAVDPASIRLIADAATNVADGGLVILTDPGFAPDADGFTIVAASAAAGTFVASGRYELLAA